MKRTRRSALHASEHYIAIYLGIGGLALLACLIAATQIDLHAPSGDIAGQVVKDLVVLSAVPALIACLGPLWKAQAAQYFAFSAILGGIFGFLYEVIHYFTAGLSHLDCANGCVPLPQLSGWSVVVEMCVYAAVWVFLPVYFYLIVET